MRYGSICSGIEAATVAWHGLGWEPAFFSEIENFPRAALQHHYPDVPLHGDFTTINGDEYGHIDLLVGGTPCQDFSVAGLRAGLAGERGNLTLEFARLVDRMRPQWVIWENVPGVLSIDGGRAFGAFLGALAEIGYGFAYRILDAQYCGVPQRRRRVFVVGYLGDWRRAAAVLFERESLLGHPAPRREAGEGIAPTISARPSGGGGLGTDFDCDGGLICLASGQANAEIIRDGSPFLTCLHEAPIIAHTLRAEGFDASEDGTGRGTPLVPVPFDTTQITSAANYSNPKPGDPCHPLAAGAHAPAIAFTAKDHGGDAGDISPTLRGGGAQFEGPHDTANIRASSGGLSRSYIAFSAKDHGADAGEIAPTLRAGGHAKSHANAGVMPAVAFMENIRGEVRVSHQVDALTRGGGKPGQGYAAALQGFQVRRLTPRECERLQGFPDDFTLVPYRNKPAADGPRYKALGNSMAVPVMRWIGERIELIEALTKRIG